MAETDPRDEKVRRSVVIPERYEPMSLNFPDPDSVDTDDDSFGYEDLPDKETFTRDLCERILHSVNTRFAFGLDDNIRSQRNQYEAVKIRRHKPWENAADLRPPMTMAITDALVANVYKAVFGANPYFTVDAEDPDDLDDAMLLQDAINSVCKSRINLPKLGRAALKRAFVDGTAVCLIYWDVQVTKRRSWEMITDELKADAKLLSQARTTLQGGQVDPSQVQQAKSLLKQIQNVPTGQYRVITREEVTHNDAKVDLIDVLDFGMYPPSVKSMDDATILFNRVWYNKAQLYQGVKSGQFDADAVEDLCSRPSQSPGRFVDQSGGDRTRFENAGLPTTDTIDGKDNPYECFRCLVKCDADDDGLAEWVLCEVAVWENILLRAEIYPYFHDRPFYALITPFPRDSMPYGYSLVDRLKDLQIELEEIRNQRVDNGTLRNNVSFAVARSLKWNPETKPFEPGMIFTVDNPATDIKVLEFGTTDQAAFAEDKLVRDDMMQLAGVNETILAQSDGSDTTARQNERALQGASTKFDMIIDDTSEGFAEIARQIKDLYGQYMPETMAFNSGSATMPVFQKITREQMQTPCKFFVYGTSALMNTGLQAQIAEKLVMFAQQSPFIQADLTRRYNAERNALTGFGVRNPEEFLGSPQNAAQMQQEKDQAPPAPPEATVAITQRWDEVASLTYALENNLITPQQYMQAAALATAANKTMEAAPIPPGASVADATDDAAGYAAPGVQAPPGVA